jgi:FAD/FMN-containing dehydrogenase
MVLNGDRSQSCWLPAACFLEVRNNVEVAVALKIATSLQTKFAVRSAGHSAGPGFSSIDAEGILIDLAGINEVALSEDRSVASVGPGNTWDRVYEELEQHELTVVGGRVAGVGVGGLILGGMYSFVRVPTTSGAAG